MSDGDIIGVRDIRTALGEAIRGKENRDDPLALRLGNGFDLAKHLEEIECRCLERAMEDAKGVKVQAAELLGLNSY